MDELFSPVLPIETHPLLTRAEEREEEMDGALADVALLLPGWRSEPWRRQAQLADALRYLADKLRAASETNRVDELRHMHRLGVG